MKIEQKQEFIDELKQQATIHFTCKKLGISRQTIYRWQKEDKDFAKKLKEARQEAVDYLNDECENRVVNKIMNDDSGMIKFWLRHHHEDYKQSYIVTK